MSYSTRSSRSSNTLISFYEGSGTDPRGRYLKDILNWDANQLEASHDYIQILFPLPEESGVNWNAPIINKDVFDAFRESELLKKALKGSFQRMAWFYGFEVTESADGSVKITTGANFAVHEENWNTRFDHNHLRITRIIRSLRVLGLEDEACAFREALENVSPIHVSSRSREYWRRAAERSLNIRPDAEVRDEQDDSVGPRFLRDYVSSIKTGEAAVLVDGEEAGTTKPQQ